MKKDIHPPIVENVGIAIIKEVNELNETEWNVYVINMRKDMLEGVLVTSKGYGNIDGEDLRTTTLRHFLDTIEPKSYAKIEPIMDNVFGLNNEYWLSFYINKVMHDKKYIFLAESVTEANMIDIPFINKKGVMIK